MRLNLFLCFLSGGLISAFGAPKNVMLIMVDDLRPQLQAFGAVPTLEGAALMHTPAMDSLAKEGTVFERAYCSVPICGASRLSLFTGSRPYKYPGKNGGRHWDYNSRLEVEGPRASAGTNHPGVTLPRHFRDHGYTLNSIGKVYHNKNDDLPVWHDLVRDRQPWGNVPAFEIGSGPKNDDDAFSEGLIAKDVLQKLATLSETPFFYGVGFNRPHLPFAAPKKYWDLYPAEAIQLPSNYRVPINAPDESLHDWAELRNYTGLEFANWRKSRLTDDYARNLIRGYYASVSYVDAQIQRIITKLKTTYDAEGVALYDKTIIVLWGDHGWNLGEHTLWAKQALYNTATQVPLVIRDPDLRAGNRVSALVESVDIYPTLCELTGIGWPEPTIDNDGRPFNLHGSSLVPLLTNPSAPWKPAVFTRYMRGDSVRTDRYAYTEFVDVADNVTSTMLFDLQQDPNENYNIVEANPGLQARLSLLLGRGPEGKRNAWRALVDEAHHNAPTGRPLRLPDAHYPDDYFKRLKEF